MKQLVGLLLLPLIAMGFIIGLVYCSMYAGALASTKYMDAIAEHMVSKRK